MSTERIEEFLGAVKVAFAGNTLVGLRLGGYHGSEADLKTIDVKKIVAKGVEKFSFTFHYKTRDIIKNQIQPEALGNLRTALRDEFRSARLATTEFDLTFERNGDKVRLKRSEVAGRAAPRPPMTAPRIVRWARRTSPGSMPSASQARTDRSAMTRRTSSGKSTRWSRFSRH